MRKLLVALLTFALIGFVPAVAVSKAGSKCTKVKTTTIVGNIKYTCIKSGNKLVWNKGVAIKKSSALKQGVCPPKVSTDKNPGITQIRANTLIGMNESQAEECAMNLDWEYRIGQRDDEFFALTKDYIIDRVTVVVTDGFVTQVAVG